MSGDAPIPVVVEEKKKKKYDIYREISPKQKGPEEVVKGR